MSSASRLPRFALLLCLAWLAVAVELVVLYWAGTAETLLDTDDAMRLVEVRGFLAGQGWFDLTEMRLEPPLGYESHWSRLIDAGLAGLFLLFKPFAGVALAERLMRTIWPLLWLMPAMLGAALIAWRLAGREAALVALVLTVIGLPALQQFKPGSIDHHNVQIALSVLTVAAAVWSDRLRWAAQAAGGLTGLALAIGLECLPYLAVCGAAFAIRYVLDRGSADALRDYGLWLAGSTAAAFLVSVGPEHWTRSVCDAIAINLALPIVLAGSVFSLAGRFKTDTRIWSRCGLVAVAGLLAATVFLMLEPRCLAGPFALMDPAVRPIWLARVHEMQPLVAFARDMPVKAAAIMAFPIAALVSAVLLARDAKLIRDFGFLVAGAAFVLALATTVAVIKAYNYPMWLGMPLVAAAALRLCLLLQLQTLTARLTAAVLLTPTVLSAGAVGIAQAAGQHAAAEGRPAEQSACFRTENYAPLARLPAGLVAADVDLGPFLLALTPHSVLAAPYHRLSAGVIAAHQALAAPPDEARAVLARVHAAYVLTCGPRAPIGLGDADRSASLWGRLQAGAPPDWLTQMPETKGQVFAAYRVNMARLSGRAMAWP
jgi:hypothetical protein